jgi:hypothetical protein
MNRPATYSALLFLSTSLLFVTCQAQTAPGSAASLLTRKAGLIFSGRVIRIQPLHGSGQFAETMRITFKVDNAIRGAHFGQTISIREWSGLWHDGSERYHLGQRSLLFLYAPSKLGLTSPVGGRFGRFQMDARDNIVLQPQQLHILTSTRRDVFQLRSRDQAVVSYRDFMRALRLTSER